MSFGTWYILSIPGRKTGKMRSIPVSVLRVNGQRYVVTGFETQWVKNARKVGRGILARGRKKEQVVLVELPVEERPPILREFPRQVPHGVPFFEKLLNLPGDPETLAAAATRCPVFRLDGLLQNEQSERRELIVYCHQGKGRLSGCNNVDLPFLKVKLPNSVT